MTVRMDPVRGQGNLSTNTHISNYLFPGSQEEEEKEDPKDAVCRIDWDQVLSRNNYKTDEDYKKGRYIQWSYGSALEGQDDSICAMAHCNGQKTAQTGKTMTELCTTSFKMWCPQILDPDYGNQISSCRRLGVKMGYQLL